MSVTPCHTDVLSYIFDTIVGRSLLFRLVLPIRPDLRATAPKYPGLKSVTLACYINIIAGYCHCFSFYVRLSSMSWNVLEVSSISISDLVLRCLTFAGISVDCDQYPRLIQHGIMFSLGNIVFKTSS